MNSHYRHILFYFFTITWKKFSFSFNTDKIILFFIISVIFILITVTLFVFNHKNIFPQKILFSALYYRNSILI